jgi:bifunctional UDP-N-acetylglucosamine pyrophosphorylase/glucosamine-1-phosphate N-acetyltransferase
MIRKAIVLAAGQGKRMKSVHSKVMHKILNEPMLEHVVRELEAVNTECIEVIVGHQKEEILDYFKDRIHTAVQEPQLGTGHALMCSLELKDEEGLVLVTYGDVPCVRKETFQEVFSRSEQVDALIVSAKLDDAGAYGRIVRDDVGHVVGIVEAKDANESQKAIQEINTGIICFNQKKLFKHIKELKNQNAQQEYYLTDMIEIFVSYGYKVDAMMIEDLDEVMGVNDRLQLAQATKVIQKRINEHWMSEGVTLIDPLQTWIDAKSKLSHDCIIHPNVTLINATLFDHVEVLGASFIQNSTIQSNTTIDSSHILDSVVGSHTNVGPHAHLRGHCVIGNHCRIGNYVEMKKTIFGDYSKSAHLTYLGDAVVGKHVNIGCGVVTVNYDGKNKYLTTIKDGAFIGSNANLVAPVTIGENALVAAGSTITKDVEDQAMGIARAHQVNKPSKGQSYKEK